MRVCGGRGKVAADTEARTVCIETVAARHARAELDLEILRGSNPTAAERVTLLQQDFFSPELSKIYAEVTVVYCNSLMLGVTTKAKLIEMLDERFPSLRLVVSGLELHDRCFQASLEVSWGSSTYKHQACPVRRLAC